MRVELVWVGPAGVTLREFDVAATCTVDEVLRLAGEDPAFAAAGLDDAVVGVFGQLVPRQHRLEEDDRVEVYRGPAVDARQARRQRAARTRR